MPKYSCVNINKLLTEKDVKALYSKCKNNYERTFLALVWIFGARPSEVLEVSKEDVNLIEEETILTVRFATKKLKDKTSFVLKERTLGVERQTEISKMDPLVEMIVSQKLNTMDSRRLIPRSRRWAVGFLHRVGMEALGEKVCPYNFRHSALTRESAKGRTIDQLKHMKGAEDWRSVNPYLHAKPFLLRRS